MHTALNRPDSRALLKSASTLLMKRLCAITKNKKRLFSWEAKSLMWMLLLTGAFLSIGLITNFLSLNEIFLISLQGNPIFGVSLQKWKAKGNKRAQSQEPQVIPNSWLTKYSSKFYQICPHISVLLCWLESANKIGRANKPQNIRSSFSIFFFFFFLNGKQTWRMHLWQED